MVVEEVLGHNANHLSAICAGLAAHLGNLVHGV